MNNVLKSNTGRGQKNQNSPLDQSDEIYVLKNFQDHLLKKIVLRGVEGIHKVILRKEIDNVFEINGIYKNQDIWVLDSVGTNLLDVLGLDYIDNTRTFGNDIVEIYNVLGIEAARQTIYNEFVEVVEFDGTYINYHNYSVLVDRMTFTHKLISIFRHGINNDNIGPIAKASFEETPEMFLKAARHAELDTLRGISANIMCGQEGYFGTSSFQVVLDMEEMQKIKSTSEYQHIDADEEIDKFFGDAEALDDDCGPNRIAIQNNVVTIQAENMGNDNSYDPGF
jgi:DNA-directed RNA polymerase II subunit RPB1